MTIDHEKLEAKTRLEEILEELGELGEEAEQLIIGIFPEVAEKVKAYQLCQFGYSDNPYDTTLQKVVDSLEFEFED